MELCPYCDGIGIIELDLDDIDLELIEKVGLATPYCKYCDGNGIVPKNIEEEYDDYGW